MGRKEQLVSRVSTKEIPAAGLPESQLLRYDILEPTACRHKPHFSHIALQETPTPYPSRQGSCPHSTQQARRGGAGFSWLISLSLYHTGVSYWKCFGRPAHICLPPCSLCEHPSDAPPSVNILVMSQSDSCCSTTYPGADGLWAHLEPNQHAAGRTRGC